MSEHHRGDAPATQPRLRHHLPLQLSVCALAQLHQEARRTNLRYRPQCCSTLQVRPGHAARAHTLHILAQAMMLAAQTLSGDAPPPLSRAGLLFRCWTQRRTVLLGGLKGGRCTDRERPPPPPLRYPRAQGVYCGLRVRCRTCWRASEPVSGAMDQQNAS